MASKKKTNAELESENKYLRKGRNAEIASSIINNAFRWGGLSFIVFYDYKSIDTLAGKFTLADIKLGASLIYKNPETNSFNWWGVFGAVGFFVGIIGVFYGTVQRKIRQRYIKYRPQRYEELEKKIDPGRSSSMLTSEGDTRPEDI
jgi:hypothetical protein